MDKGGSFQNELGFFLQTLQLADGFGIGPDFDLTILGPLIKN